MKKNNIKSISCTLSVLAILTMVSSSTYQANADEYWEQKVSLFDTLPVYSNDIVFVGNSITDGGHFNELFEMDNVKNRGIRSDAINGVKKRISQVTKGHPKKIFLLIGINDVAQNLTVSELAKRYESLVQTIRRESPESKLYVQSVMPVNNTFKRYKTLFGKENTILAFNREIQKIAEQNDAVYLDLWPFLADSKGQLKKEFTNDGLHLKGAGYKAWVKGIEKYVKE